MSEQPWLVTTCVFKGNQFLVKMNTIRGHSLDLSVVDKHSGEEWSSKYDSKFIENLTLKTGNYKRFDIFITMLKSGLLRTSDCVSLDLLTFEDLELLRGKRKDKNGCKIDSPPSSRGSAIASTNRRYLILTYTVEFDRIHYPLPMEYIGPPNPRILQATIRKLEAEVQKLKSRLNDRKESSNVEQWKDRVKHLEAENWILQEEVAHLRQLFTKRTGGSPPTDPLSLSSSHIPVALQALEEQVKKERESFRATIHGLQEQNHRLRRELDELKSIPRDPKKPDPVHFLWKRHVINPTVNQKNGSTRINENMDNKPHFTSRNDAWRTRLNNPNVEVKKPNHVASDRRSRRECVNKNTVDHHKQNFSETDVQSRKKGPNVVKPYPQKGNRTHSFSKGWENHHVASSCDRTSSSSECSSARGRPQMRKPKSQHSRTSSQASTSSVSSSLTSSSVSKRDKVHRRNAQGDAGFMNPSKISSFEARAQSLLSKCQPTHRKNPQKSSRRGTTCKMSDLETRIKALQNMLKEGLSLP